MASSPADPTRQMESPRLSRQAVPSVWPHHPAVTADRHQISDPRPLPSTLAMPAGKETPISTSEIKCASTSETLIIGLSTSRPRIRRTYCGLPSPGQPTHVKRTTTMTRRLHKLVLTMHHALRVARHLQSHRLLCTHPLRHFRATLHLPRTKPH